MDLTKAETLALLQKSEMEILNVFAGFCEKHDLVWFVDSGTALGARRHGGFIPWDDDIDVGMLRPDYDRFLELTENGFVDGYSVHTADNTANYAAMFAKVYKEGTSFLTEETIQAGCEQGIFIDIFPYDALSGDEAIKKRQRYNAKMWQSISYLFHSRVIVVPGKGFVGLLQKAACAVAHYVVRFLFSPEKIVSSFNKSVLRDLEETATEYISLPWQVPGSFKKEDLLPAANLSFEGRQVPVPSNIDAYLGTMYGNWNVLPPEEDRKTHLPVYLDFGNGITWRAEKGYSNGE